MIEVVLPIFLKEKLPMQGPLLLRADSLTSLFDALSQLSESLVQDLWSADRVPHNYVKVYVNQEDIRYLGGPACQLQAGDEIVIAVKLHTRC
jgi:molybdopterin converting factor small subunit